MEITIETDSYNHRRYGRPWIAKVDFNKSVKGDFAWGDWAGDHYNGGAGVLTIGANPGDIIAQGQKDNRNPRNSAPDFNVVGTGGKLEYLGDKGDAYKYFLEIKAATPDLDALRKERTALLARIAEINAIIGN
jgi:hypothetical protein